MKKIICFGDSITDCNRFFSASPLGNGYVNFLNSKLGENNNVNIVINKGFDGFTIKKIEHVIRTCSISSDSICTLLAGINDIALMLNTNRTSEQKEDMIQQFSQTYESVILEILKSTDRLILMEPFIFPYPAEFQNWIPYVRILSDIIHTLAEKYNLPFIFLHDKMNFIAEQEGFPTITTDGVHLTDKGHRIIANELFHFLCKGNIKTL